MKFLPILAVVLLFIGIFVVPNQNGETVFDAVKSYSATDTSFWHQDNTDKEEITDIEHLEKDIDEQAEEDGVNKGKTTEVEKGEKKKHATPLPPERNDTQGGVASHEDPPSGNSGDTKTPIQKPSAELPLTPGGVLAWTNYYRGEHELPSLHRNTTLVTAAKLKVYDMFEGQYFEHTSPDGIDIADVAKNLGYKYISIGENLALGDFSTSKDLVDAWMESPGHRENILSKSYDEIGIAMKFGNFDGKKVWLAAQEFGRPRSDCPSPSQQLKSRIEINKGNKADLSEKLQEATDKLSSMNQSKIDAYNAEVDVYNQLAQQINTLKRHLRDLIAEYNTQVNAFNECASR